MACAPTERGRKARGLAQLPVREIGNNDDVLGVGFVRVDAGETHGKDRAWLGDAGVIVLRQTGEPHLGEGIIGY